LETNITGYHDDPRQTVPEFDPVFEIGPEVADSFPALNGEAGERIRKSVELHGMDALGWYSSFHVTSAQWGIYIPVSGIVYLTVHALRELTASNETKAHLAFHAILNHELFHFATDYAVAQAELLFEEPWWGPAKTAFSSNIPDYCMQEEKLANAYMLKAFRTMKPALRVRGKQEALKKFTLLQPAGYCDGDEVQREGWESNLHELASSYLAHSNRARKNPHLWTDSEWDWPQLFPIHPHVDWRYCPIHLVLDGKRFGIPEGYINLFSRLGSIVESKDFQRKYKKLSPELKKAWERTKGLLGRAITRGADFKKWPSEHNNVWSVRVNKGFRAHLRQELGGVWTALAIGNHKEMGHG
jgi:hypothetical protein